MRGTCIKMIENQQGKICNNYKNTWIKLLKTNAAVRFNKICKIKQTVARILQHQNQWKQQTKQEHQNSSNQIQNKPRNQISVL